MNQDRWRRLRAYVLSANATMGQIPAPVPPRPEEGWDGPTFDTREMYMAYSQLPADLQELAAASHTLCENALAAQSDAALRAYAARCVLMIDVVQETELAHHVDELYPPQPEHEYLTLVEDEEGQEEDEDDEDDEDEVSIAEIQREVDAYVRGLVRQRDQAAAAAATESPWAQTEHAEQPEHATVAVATAAESPAPAGRATGQGMMRAWAASATVMAAVCASLLIWHHAAAPAPAAVHIKPIHQTVQARGVTAIVSYASHTADATELHVHVVNTSSHPEPADLSLGGDDHDPLIGPILIPPRSTQHRVLRVRKDRDRTKPVVIRLENAPSLELVGL